MSGVKNIQNMAASAIANVKLTLIIATFKVH